MRYPDLGSFIDIIDVTAIVFFLLAPVSREKKSCKKNLKVYVCSQ